jgi:outer membrane murein-binding lipoprotein Lpp
MTITTSTRTARAVVGLLAVGGLLLTGCTAGQSKEDACTQLNADIKSASDELTSSISTLATDPEGAIAALEDFRDSFGDTVDEISNEEIKDLAENTEDALENYVDEVSAAAADPENADSEAVMGSVTEFQEQTQAISDACGS